LVSIGPSTLKVLSIFIFGYTCQHNTFAVTNELSQPSQKRLDSVFQFSILTALVLYFAVALAGYSTYGNMVTPDLLKGYPSECVRICIRVFFKL
jgi:amino acid permease